MFSGVGAFFAYRAWRQKNDEIKEKYFERRLAVYLNVREAVSNGLRRGSDFGWSSSLLDAKQRAEFLFGPDAQNALVEIHDLLAEHDGLVSSDDVAERTKSTETRKRIRKKLEEVEVIMKRYLTIAK